jgi:hypothetical protein
MSRPATRLASAVLGIALFVASFAVFRLLGNPPEGAGALVLEVAGWVGMFFAARIITGAWLAPSLVVSAWLLLFVGGEMGARLLRRGHDRGLQLGFNYVMALITLETGAWLLVAVMMLDGAAKLWREDSKRTQAPRAPLVDD